MSDLRFSNLSKIYGGGVVALEEFSLEIPSPRLVVLVGPSGCGKTTLLRLIAGLETPTTGTITLGGNRLDPVDPRRRDVAMVFQNYALYPHMTVRENLSFGLRIRRVARDIVSRRVIEVARSLEIEPLLERRPGELSGGQRQRVALGRAVIREPKVFLFDEPLSNLDARLRDEMRYMIKRLYERLRTTTVYVTHDQVEAMTIGELLVVLRSGRIHQVGTPRECYQRPADTFVASFLGSPPMNLLDATYDPSSGEVRFGAHAGFAAPGAWRASLDRSGEREITIGVRPEHVLDGGSADRGACALRGRVVLCETLGHEVLTHVDVGAGEVVARSRAPVETSGTGDTTLFLSPAWLHVFSKRTGGRIDVPAAGPAGGTGP